MIFAITFKTLVISYSAQAKKSDLVQDRSFQRAQNMIQICSILIQSTH